MGKKIYLSPSNQDGNLYAYGNTNECDQCNRIADAAKTALERCGFTVKKAPKGQEMDTSIAESNAWGADLHIPIHTNAYTNSGTGTAGGTLVFIYADSKENHKFADPIYQEVQKVTPGKTDYGVRVDSRWAELNSTKAVAVYIEVDFHDNPSIAKWLIENPKTVGEAIAKGVCKGYGVKYTPPQTEPTPIPGKSDVFYRVQVGAFSSKTLADAFLETVKKAGFTNSFIVEVKK